MTSVTDGPKDTGSAAAAGEVPVRRADARRNRELLLNAAEAAFAESGLGVPVDEIARRAGVGAGTLYRNFPTKEALFQAVIADHMERLADQAERLAESAEPGAALFEFLELLASEGTSKRNLIEALMGAGLDVKLDMGPVKERLDQAAAVLLERAQRSGSVRTDVTVPDLFGLVIGACRFPPTGGDEPSPVRMVSVICAGLRV